MLKYAFVLFAACLVTPSQARAETPEQAVAYAFLGLADAATLTRGKTHLVWRETAQSPATFEGHGEGGGRSYDVRFTVTALGACEYEIYLAGDPRMIRGGRALYARILLDKVTDIVPTESGFTVGITGGGFCGTGSLNANCTVVDETDLYGTLDADKHIRLVEYLRNEVCKSPRQ
jgi:hypothetical protein